MLSEKQRGVLGGMAAAFVAGAVCLVAAVVWAPTWLLPGGAFPATLAWSMQWDVAVVFCLALSIGLLAKHRFFTPDDIDGSGLTAGTSKAHVLQSVLQNTLEQSVLAIGIHSAWAVVMPVSWQAAVPVAALLFVIGRILFWKSYARGAAARSFGFALTFYPTLLMLFAVAAFMVYRSVA